MRTFLHNYFGFNRQQRNGVLVLMCISLLLLVVRIVYPYFLPRQEIIAYQLPVVKSPAPVSQSVSSFDPNTATTDMLVAAGLPQRMAERLVKFRNKGFVFRKPEDLRKLYGMTDRLYASLLPLVTLAPAPVKQRSRQVVHMQVQPIELNSTDSAELTKLKGIGPGFARKIIKYRNLLGGYHSVAQLREVYGFTPELFDRVKDHVTADASKIVMLDVNKDDFKSVNRHPYITYEQCREIFNLRRKETITSASLRELLGDEALYEKLAPYLKWQ
jgi:competence protein ComEA